MRTRYIALIVVVGLIALWMADVGEASEYAWLTLAFVALAAIAILIGMAIFMGLSWAWVGTLNGRIIPMVIIAALSLAWVAAMSLGPVDRGPLDCGGPTMAGYVC